MKSLDIERTFPEIENLILDEDWWIFDGKKEIASSDCYNYYYSYAKSWKPQSILEIGVRRGYSAVSMALGAGEKLNRFVGIDSEIDVEGSASFASGLLSNRTNAKIEILNFDTQQDDFSISGDPFDLIHIDADHSFLGCSSDLLLCLGLAKEGSIIIVDDALYAPVRAACEQIKGLYKDFLDVRYVTNFRGHCLITVKRTFPELLNKQARQSVLDTIQEIFPKVTVDKLIQEYSAVRNDLEKGSVAHSEAAQKLLSNISFHLSELATSLQDRIKNYCLDQSTEQGLISALTNLKQPMSLTLQGQTGSGQGMSPKGILGFQGLVTKTSPEQKTCQTAFAMLAHIEQFMLLLKSKPIGKCFSYFLGEASKHFAYLHERLYSQAVQYSSMEELSLSKTKYAYASSGRIQTFEGHGLAVMLIDALINVVTSLNRELESQYWMGYWDAKANRTWTQMVLKGQEAVLSPTPFPVKTEEEYSQFYGFQTITTAGGVSVKPGQATETDLYRQLIQNPTNHAFRLATSICHIKLLLSLLQDRHPYESIKWLDVGCGIGYIANKVGFDGEFVGIDVAQPLIDYATETRFSERYTYLTGGFDEARNAIGGEKFHLITANEVIEHIFDPLNFVAQMKDHTCDLIYASSPLNEAVPHQPSREHLWKFSLESYEQLFVLSDMKVTFSSSMHAGKFIGEGHNWLSVAATTGDVLRVLPKA